ncbi:XF1762 family protein [Streptomyces acidiscabies]|uniref:XF1762 family protein n=1 Tax=Streptomyces acidiscabies TaxID=42234 RepID=UPI0038F6F9F9
MTIVPLTFREACGIVGRTVSRVLDDRLTSEVPHVATGGTPNACSALYRAAWGAASRMGFRRAITSTQDGESGASLRAAGWRPVTVLRPRSGWDTPSRRREERGTQRVGPVLWERCANGAPELPALEDLRNPM